MIFQGDVEGEPMRVIGPEFRRMTMRGKRIAAMGTIGMVLGAGSLLATPAGASAGIATRTCAARCRDRDRRRVAVVDRRPARERRPEDRGGCVHVARRNRLAPPGDAPHRRATCLQRDARDHGPFCRRVVGAARRPRLAYRLGRPSHDHVPIREPRSDRRAQLPYPLRAVDLVLVHVRRQRAAGEHGDDRPRGFESVGRPVRDQPR